MVCILNRSMHGYTHAHTHIVLESTAISTGDSVCTPSHPLPLSPPIPCRPHQIAAAGAKTRGVQWPLMLPAILRQMELANLTLGLFCFHPLIIYIIICCILLLLWPTFLVMCRYPNSAVRIGALPVLQTGP